MSAWLERVHPAGERIELPDGKAALVFGRSPRSTIVFDDPGIAARHCELSFDGSFWRLKDLGTEQGTLVNGSVVTHPRALFHGDEVQFGALRLRFASDAPATDTTLLAAIAREPDQPEPWLVYADWLQEQGDPLGERIARASRGERLDHLPWVEPLFDALVSGELEVDWHLGFARKLVLRPVVGRLSLDWRNAVSTALNLRVGRFVRELVIDVPRLDVVPPGRLSAALLEAQRFLARLPALPAALERLSLGYLVALPPNAPTLAIEELSARAPRLKDAEVFTRGAVARLKLLSSEPGVRLSGLEHGARVLSGVLRLRRGTRDQVFFESPPGIPFVTDGNPCYLSLTEGRCVLMAGKLRGELKVNGRVDSAYQLLPGDLIELQAAARLRFEVSRE